MIEKGSMKQIEEKYATWPQVCPDLNGKALSFGSVFTAFGILSFGGGMAIIIFLAETLAKFLGMHPTILSSYGVGDAPPFDEKSIWRILMIKDTRIKELEKENAELHQIGSSFKK